MRVMSAIYHQLLDATIQHLQDLKAQGQRYVAVSPETLQVLAQPLPRAPQPSEPIQNARAPQSSSRPAQPPAPTPATRSAQTPLRPVAPPQAAELALALAGPTDAPPAATVALSPEAKAAAFAELRERAMVCVKCPHLAASRRNVVFGVGNINAELMFIGEAPGADEDEQAEPFVGKAGQLLTKIIQTMGLQRGDVYIGNILKCRPDTPGQTAGNRKPTAEEMQTCIPYLHGQIDLIRPKVIVALGATAVEGLLGKTIGITKLRGTWKTYRGIPLMPTYHPAYLLRNQALSEKRKVWEDMLQVMEKLGMTITEKQRKFFLKP
jgi:uracil-DNA glycosylase family 4